MNDQPSQGTYEVRQAVSDKLKRDNGLVYSPEEVIITAGAKQAVANPVRLRSVALDSRHDGHSKLHDLQSELD